MEPITMFFAGKWFAAHAVAAHAAAGHAAAGHAAAGHAAVGHAAAGHAAVGHAAAGHAGVTTILGTPIAASTIGGITFRDVYKRLVDDVYDGVSKGLRSKPSPQEMREISSLAYEMATEALKEKQILLKAADRDEMDSLKRQVDYAFAA
jgi:hypothetical protein